MPINPIKYLLILLSLSFIGGCTSSLEGRQSGVIRAEALAEISGLAASNYAPGNWWVHNDGHHGSRVFLISEDGSVDRRVELSGVDNNDWEDMAAFQYQQQAWLLIGDIGDNFSKRQSIQLHFLPEPETTLSSAAIKHSLQLTYPDGPRDSESVAVDPVDNTIYLLSKRDHPARLYRISVAQAFARQSAELEFVGEVDSIPAHSEADIIADPEHGQWSDQATAMDISADGSLIALQTYKMTMLFKRAAGMSVLDALNGKAMTYNTDPLAQEEAIAFSRDGKYLLIATEKLPAPLLRLEIN
ncbi:MAG: hypothetical protein L3J24_07565 [Xanthomonadales bacterium]|nr:hypothetical protein [Xanthomonadales bacterium]